MSKDIYRKLEPNIEKLSRRGYVFYYLGALWNDITPFGGHPHDILIKKDASVVR